MRKFERRLTVIFLILFSLTPFLSGCQSRSSEETEPTLEVTVENEPTTVAEGPEGSSEETTEDVALVEKAAEVNQCLNCHTDQERLEETADPVAEVESESSGEG